MDAVSLTVGLIGGGLITWLVAHFYYRRQLRDQERAYRRLQEGFDQAAEKVTLALEQAGGVASAGDFFMGLATFNKELRPELEHKYEIKLPAEGRLFAFLERRWSETFIDHRGQRKRVAIGERGRIDNVPVIRRRLSDGARKMLLAAYSLKVGQFAHSMQYHERPPFLTIAGVSLEGLEARNVLRELLDEGLVEQHGAAIYRLTPEGVERAEELAEAAQGA